MKKFLTLPIACFTMLFLLTGCGPIGDKTASLSVIYIATALISSVVLAVYCCIIKKKDLWFLLLFSMISVVNLGYLSLSFSVTLEEALLANRISYLGSVFLPFSMLFIILNVCKYKYKKWLPVFLSAVSTVMFFIAASPGYSDIYYKDVTLNHVNGVTVLDKVYGSWHSVYLFYLVIYFSVMIFCTAYTTFKRKNSNTHHVIILIIAVTVNIGVWLIEQLVKIDFEILSVSYIISELFLLILCFMLQDEKAPEITAETTPTPPVSVFESESSPEDNTNRQDEAFLMQCEFFASQIKTLTPTEKTIFTLYLDGKRTKDIMEELNIKENTIKYHNKNIYSKLGVSSRKQMLEIASALKIDL